MPPSAPVPSKGALRTLRNLALGTSCTVAFGAGMLTEDRRRRIQTAREVHNNAKKIKASRQYHSAGTTLAESFDEEIISDLDDSFWQPRKSQCEPGSRKRIDLLHWRPLPKSNQPVPIKKSYLHDRQLRVLPWTPLNCRPSPEPPSVEINKPQTHNRQHDLVIDVPNLLGAGEDPMDVEAAAFRFIDAFEDGLCSVDSGLCQKLIDSAVQISEACAAHGKSEISEKIFDIVLSSGSLTADSFFSFNPEAYIQSSLKGQHNPKTLHKDLDIGELKKACAIFLTEFKDGTIADTTRTRAWTKLGHQLCREACFFGLFKLTEDIFWRLEKSPGDSASRATQYLLKAAYGQKDYKRVIQYFRRFYVRTSPKQAEFYRVGKLVIDSAIEIPQQDFELAGEVLLLMLDMAKREGLTTSTTYVLRLLGTYWRSRKDISEVRALFLRLKPLLHFASHPQAVYGAIIQFCVEADDETSARLYYSQMREEFESNPDDVRIYGHFAYLKAMKKDWEGVRHDFNYMKALGPKPNEYSDAFTPIFLLFAKSGSIRETEEFLQEFLEDFDVKLRPNMSNIMIDKYLQAKEINSVSRWFEYMHTSRTPIAPQFFNTILINCFRKWNFSFQEVIEVYISVTRLGSWTSHFINQRTRSTLCQIALSNGSKHTLEMLKAYGIDIGDSVDQKDLREGMAECLAKGDAFSALKQYRNAVAEQIPISSAAVSLAVEASLRLHPDNIDISAALLQESRRKGLDISEALSSIFIHQISAIYRDITTSCEDVKEISRNTINALERRGVPVPVRVATHTMSILSKRKQYRMAIEFWGTISARNGCTPMPLDIATLTVILQAYLALRDHTGLKWVIQMLRVHELTPDKRFKLALKEARRLEQRRKDKGRHFNMTILEEVINALEVVKVIRADAVQDKKIVNITTIKLIKKARKVVAVAKKPIADL